MQGLIRFEGVNFYFSGGSLDSLLPDLLHPSQINSINRSLRLSAHLGKRYFVKAVLAAGADRHDKYNGDTALTLAVRRGYVGCVLELITETSQEELNDALIEAVTIGERPICIDILLTKGANPEAINANGESAIILAARTQNKYKQYECIRSLLAAGANDEEALFTAINNGDTQSVHVLLMAGAQASFPDLISIASQKKNPEIIAMLDQFKESELNIKKETSLLLKNHSLFKEYESSFLIANRHNDANLQHEYDKQYGLVAIK